MLQAGRQRRSGRIREVRAVEDMVGGGDGQQAVNTFRSGRARQVKPQRLHIRLPVVHGKAERDGRAVEGIEGIVEAEAVPRGQLRASVQKLVEQRLEHGGVAPVHGVRERRLRDGLHAKVAETSPVGQKTIADLAQGVLAGDLRVQAGEELPPGGEMPAIAVGAVRLDGFFKTMSGDELEKLGKDGIVLHGSRFGC